MTKFFLAPVKNQKGHFFKNKKKINKVSCNESLFKMIMDFIQKCLTRQIQKTIRKIKQSQSQHKEVLQKYFQQLKLIKKADLKKLSYYILKNQMKVEEQNLKITLKIQSQEAKIQQDSLDSGLKKFYQSIKDKQAYKKQITQMQKVRTGVQDKKKTKKEKIKMKKKTKLINKKLQNQKASDNQDSQSDKQDQDKDSNVEEEIIRSSSQEQVQEQAKALKYPVRVKEQKKPMTQFKKTGRNKFLFEKKNGKFNIKAQRKITTEHRQRKQDTEKPPGRYDTPHPSWQAKRQIKNQMFIKPFEGKRIFL